MREILLYIHVLISLVLIVTAHDASDECSPNPCKHGTCTDGDQSFTCACDVGFNGKTCCSNIDDCIGGPCGSHGQCNDGIDSYTCTCNTGYDGDHCENNIDDCTPDPCNNVGNCTDGVASFTCSCPPGYTGNCDGSLNLVHGYTNVTQSSKRSSANYYFPKFAVDEKASTSWWKCINTGSSSTDPWWQVELDQAYPVRRLRIMDRDNVVIVPDIQTEYSIFVDNDLCTNYTGPKADGLTWREVTCDVTTLVGRYVKITRPTGYPLLLCEVEIYLL